MIPNLGFKPLVLGVDYMNNELRYWRGLLTSALNTSRNARRAYPNADALREALRALEVYWLGDSRDKPEWDAVCNQAMREIAAFNQWVSKK